LADNYFLSHSLEPCFWVAFHLWERSWKLVGERSWTFLVVLYFYHVLAIVIFDHHAQRNPTHHTLQLIHQPTNQENPLVNN
jgi:hypothetical protein